MNDELDGQIVVPTTNDPGGHHDAHFAREPRLQLRLLSVLVEMGMKMSGPHACHIVGHGHHLLDQLPCPAIHHGPIRLRRNVAIPFDELLNDFLVHISHFIDDVFDQGEHRGHPDNDESRRHHDLEVRFLKRGQGGRQRDELPSTAHNDNRRFMMGLKSDNSKCASSTMMQ